jgi:chemotaxis protein methyltransferase CheR
VYQHCRINLGDNKKELVSARLGKRLRTLEIGSYKEYCNLLETSGDELTQMVDAITTNHTQFFREMKHFDFLEQVGLPQVMSLAGKNEYIRVWSAASSSGEEPYSLAIFLSEHLTAKGRPWRIDATDISTKILDKAKLGVYSEDRVSEIRHDWLRKYFQKGTKKWEGHYRVKESLRQMVHYQNLNLLQERYPFSESFHIIFCRNVMIYFDRETQQELLPRLVKFLCPGGYLMIGHSESLTAIQHGLKCIRPAIYQKPM